MANSNSTKLKEELMIIIVCDQLTGPPTWPSSFRELTMICFYRGADIVIESSDPDPYWKYLKRRGCMDYVRDFVGPGTERGIRLDIKEATPQTIVVPMIVPENVVRIAGMIGLEMDIASL